MKCYALIILSLAMLLDTSSMIANNIDNTTPVKTAFITAEIEEAEKLAIREGKMLVIDFNAKWCLPCRWMDEQTFVDPELIKVMNDNFIPVQYDIESFDGVALKFKYSITKLPTILIISPDGEEIKRIQESLSANALKHELLNILANNSFEKRPYYKLTREPLTREIELSNEIVNTITLDKSDLKIDKEYFIQFAVFSTKISAENYINSNKEKGLVIEKLEFKTKTLFAVRSELLYDLVSAELRKVKLAKIDNVLTMIKKVN